MRRWPADFPELASADSDLRLQLIRTRIVDDKLQRALTRHFARLGQEAQHIDDRSAHETMRAALDAWRALLRAKGLYLPVPVLTQPEPTLTALTPQELVDEIEEAKQTAAARGERAEISNIVLRRRPEDPPFIDEDNLIDLDQLTLANCRFIGIEMANFTLTSSTNFVSVGFRQCTFSGTEASGAVFTDGKFEDCTFPNAIFVDTDFSRSSFIRAKFDHANLEGANFSSVYMQDVKLRGVEDNRLNAQQAMFTKAQLGRFVATHVDLSRAAFFDTNFGVRDGGTKASPPQFTSCALEEAYFVRTNLQRAGFQNCELHRVRFDHVSVQHADFLGAGGLSKASLRGTADPHTARNLPQDLQQWAEERRAAEPARRVVQPARRAARKKA